MDPEKFLRKVFKRRPDAKRIFDQLVELGCDRSMLRNRMVQISSTLVKLRSKSVCDRRYLSAWDFLGVPSYSEVKKLIDRLLWAARAIGQLKQSPTFEGARRSIHTQMLPFLAAATGQTFVSNPPEVARQFSELPQVLFLYAVSLRGGYKFLKQNFGPKKYDIVTAMEAMLVATIKRATGQFHFDKIGILLEASWEILAGSNLLRRDRFTGDAVRRRYERLQRRRKLAH